MSRQACQARTYRATDRQSVVALWEACGLVTPGNEPGQDIDLKVAAQPELFFVGELDGDVVATVMAGYDGHRGWINYLAASPEHRGQGLGQMMMQHAEAELVKLGCPKINLQIREDNADVQAFYESLGYTVEARISLGKRIDKSV